MGSARCSRRAHEPDVLSDVLRTVRLTGAMLFLVDATAPWRSQAPRRAHLRAAR